MERAPMCDINGLFNRSSEKKCYTQYLDNRANLKQLLELYTIPSGYKKFS